ncbi:MAG TPA: amino acid ABC transporter permease [Roseiarcus sp.]|jgi:polar amino acid transport system permease protein
MGYTLNFAAVWRSFDLLLDGLGLSLALAFGGVLIGCAIGIFVAFNLTVKSRMRRGPAQTYVTIIRNTPILVLILFVYFGLPQLGVSLSKTTSFVLTLAVYSGAYLAEVFRAGLAAVPPGLREAGLAIGLRESQIRMSVILPLMLRNALPSLGSTFISLFKDTSLAAAIAIPELTFEARKINVETFRVVETWIVTSLLYVATCSVLAALIRVAERRIAIPR